MYSKILGWAVVTVGYTCLMLVSIAGTTVIVKNAVDALKGKRTEEKANG